MPRTPSKQTRLGRLRIIAGCDGKALAADAGISYQLLKMIETGSRNMTEETARRIARATGVSSQWLLGHGLKSKPTTDRSRIERFSKELFTREYYEATRATLEAGNLSLKTNKDVSDFCRIEATNHGYLLAKEMEMALRGAVRLGQESKVLATVEKCLQSLRKLTRSYLTDEERDINALFAAAVARRRKKLTRA